MPPAWLDELNPAQRDAVTHGDGPLLIVAGAGTGKTKTLACRVAALISRGTPPDRILLLTFTRRAAAEMLRRVDQLTARDASAKVWGGTFHAVSNRLLRLYGRAIGLADEFTVMDQEDSADIMNLIRGERKLGDRDRRFPRKETLIRIYSRTVNAREKLGDVLQKQFPWCADEIDGIREVFEQYTRRKREQRVLDYDDLLLFWSALCNAPIGRMVAERFDHVLVDEYQDTNAVQCEILRGMRQSRPNITVVGDDAQSIYSFRAATVRNILDFPQQFAGARVVALEQNYRSTTPILAASNAVMDYAAERYTKQLWSQRESGGKPVLLTCVDEPHQCHEVCRRILAHREEGIPLARQAVLFRTGHHSGQLEVELQRRNIPFHKWGGLKFVEAAHIKDMLAFLRVLENPYDEVSWFRVLQMLDGIGPSAARRVLDHIGARGDPSDAGPAADSLTEKPSAAVRPRPSRANPAASRRIPANAAEPAPRAGRPIADRTDPVAARDVDARRDSPAPAAEPTFDPAAEDTPRDKGALASPLRSLFERTPAVPPAAREHFRALIAALAECCGWSVTFAEKSAEVARQSGPAPALGVQLDRLRQFYEPVFRRNYDNPDIRLRDLEQLGQIAAGYASRQRFITDLTLDPPASTSDLAGAPHLDDDYLILSTIHSAKGCEWDSVHIIHAADGNIPSDMSTGDAAAVEEERRLLYVAMTRARDHLYIYFPLRYYHTKHALGDGHSYAQLTRFIPPDIQHLFEKGSSSLPAEMTPIDEADISQETSAADTVDAYLTDLWSD